MVLMLNIDYISLVIIVYGITLVSHFLSQSYNLFTSQLLMDKPLKEIP